MKIKTQNHLVSYIIVHIIPLNVWATLSYHEKMRYHHLVTVAGKTVKLKKLLSSDGCVEVVFIGNDNYAHDSGALFSLLVDLWMAHPVAKIIYATDLYNAKKGPVITARHWLAKHMPVWIQRRLPKCSNLFTLRSLLPHIF
jgi:hypothetical protein